MSSTTHRRTRPAAPFALLTALSCATLAAVPSCSKESGGSFPSGDDATDDSTTTLDAPFSFSSDAPFISLGDSGTFNAGSACKPGDYSGTFMCAYQYLNPTADSGDASSLFNLMVMGPVTLTLTQGSGANGESFLSVTGGSVSGTTVGGSIGFTAQMAGQLDCATGQFQGELVNGKWSGTGANPLNLNGMFQVSFDAAYDNKNYRFVNGVSGGGCIGTWSASYVGPAGSAGGG
jgi:hypothetical protein